MKRQYWLAELTQHGNPDLIDGPHDERAGAEQALELRKKLRLFTTTERRFAIAEITLSFPQGFDGGLNEQAIEFLNGGAS